MEAAISRNDNQTQDQVILTNKLSRGLAQNGDTITASSNFKNGTFTDRVNSRLFNKDQIDLKKSVYALEGIGNVHVGSSPAKNSIAFTNKTFTQTVPRDNLKKRQYKRESSVSISNHDNDKTLDRRESIKYATAAGSQDSREDSLGRASEQTIKMTETVKLAVNPGQSKNLKEDNLSTERKYPPLSMRMASVGKENLKNQTILPKNTYTDSLNYKNSVVTNPEELKKFVNVDFENWQEIMSKATAGMNTSARIVKVNDSPH